MKQQVVFQIGKDLNDNPLYHSFNESDAINLMLYGVPGSGAGNQVNYIVRKLIEGNARSSSYTVEIIDCGEYAESQYWIEGIRDNKHFIRDTSVKSNVTADKFVQVLTELSDEVEKRYSMLKELNYRKIIDYNEAAGARMDYKVVVFTGLQRIFNSSTSLLTLEDISRRFNMLSKSQRATGFFFFFDCCGLSVNDLHHFAKLSTTRIVLRCNTDVSALLTETNFPARMDEKAGCGYYYNSIIKELRKYYTGAVLDGKCGVHKEVIKYEFTED